MTFKCEICGNDFIGEWTDFHGEATCSMCGTPYQILSYHGAKPDEKFPSLGIDDELVPIFKEYWNETHRIHREGRFMDDYGQADGQHAFRNWLTEKYPELMTDD